MKYFFVIPVLFLFYFDTYCQVDIQVIKSQSYLKYKAMVNCDSAETTLELRICANLAFQRSDSLLGIIYNDVLSHFTTPDLKKEKKFLEKSQKRWIEYRDEYCNLYWKFYEGGSLQPVAYLNCLTDLTDERITELKKFLKEINVNYEEE